MTVLVHPHHWELPKFTVRSHSAGAEAAGQAAHRMMSLSATRLTELGAWLQRAEDAHDVRGRCDPTFQFDPTLLVRRTMR